MGNKAVFAKTKFSVGDTIKVHQIIEEKGKKRTQVFEGIVIKIRGSEENKSFVVRKISAGGIGVERIWPVLTPWIEKIEVVKKGKVRRAKLYYLRKKVGKKATRVKQKLNNDTLEPKTKSGIKPEEKKTGKTGRRAS